MICSFVEEITNPDGSFRRTKCINRADILIINDPCYGLCYICAYKKTRAERDRQRESLERIQRWQRAYPLAVFPKPDLKKAHKALKAAGMTLDAISADAMRHVLDGIKDIVEQGLQGDANGKTSD